MRSLACFLLICTAACSVNVSAADLSEQQVEQQIHLAQMLGQISKEEQEFRVQKVRTLGVDGYYEWLQNDTRSSDQTTANNNAN